MSGLPWDGEEVYWALDRAVVQAEDERDFCTRWTRAGAPGVADAQRVVDVLRALLAALPEVKEAMAYVAAGDLFDQAVGREEEEYCIRLECEAMERYRAARAARQAKEESDG